MRAISVLIVLALTVPLAQAKSSRSCAPAYNVHSVYGDGHYADGFSAVVRRRLVEVDAQHVRFRPHPKSIMCGRTLFLSEHLINW
jgi:hypothetical protein